MGETGPTEAQTTNPAVTGHDLLWLNVFSQKSVETRGRTISNFFFFYLLCGHKEAYVRIKGSWESAGAIQPLPVMEEEQRGREMNNIMIYDKDEDQKTVNLKRETVLFLGWGGLL